MSHTETPLEFIRRKEGVEAAITRIGLNTTQLILVASDGEWLRFVVADVESANEAARRLGLVAHDGMPDGIRMRMANYVRTPADWAAAPYPEKSRGTST